MGNTNPNPSTKQSSLTRKHSVSSPLKTKNSSSSRNQSPLTTISSFNIHPQQHNEQQDSIGGASHALIGIGVASSSHCSLFNQQHTPSSPVLLSSSINTSFNGFPALQHVDSDMTSLPSITTSGRNSRTALSTSIHIHTPTCTDINTTTNSTTIIHVNTPTSTTTESCSIFKSRQSLPHPPSSVNSTKSTRLQENTGGYRRSLSTPKLSLLKKKNVIKAFFMLHRRNTLDEAEMNGEDGFGRVTDVEEYIPMQNGSSAQIDISPQPLPVQRPRVHSMAFSVAVTSTDSSSSATRAGADTDTDTTIAAEQDEKKIIANVLNKSFSKARNIIKSQPHNNVEIPSSDHGKLPNDRKHLERSASAPQIMTNELELLLRDAMGFQLFKDFCVAEFSVENLNCWQELLDMEKNFIDMSGKRRSRVINMVYDKFIDDGSSEEVNIRGKTKKLVDTERKSGTINLDTSKQILHEIKRDLYTNLVDSFSRFIYTDEYKLWHELKTNPSNVFE